MKNTDRITLKWKKRPLKAKDYLAFNNQILNALTRFDDIFKHLFFWFQEDELKKCFYKVDNPAFHASANAIAD